MRPNANDDDALQPNPGCWLLVLPVLAGIGVVIAYGYLFYTGAQGRPADGDRVVMAFEGCPEALPVVQARVERMGLGDPSAASVEGGFTVTARLPAESRVAGHIPETLAKQGHFSVVDPASGTVIVEGHVEDTELHLGLMGTPTTIVQLDEQGATTLREWMETHHEGKVGYVIDGTTVKERTNLPAEPRGRLELEPYGDLEQDRMESAAERSLILSNPLPCEVTLRSAEPVPP